MGGDRGQARVMLLLIHYTYMHYTYTLYIYGTSEICEIVNRYVLKLFRDYLFHQTLGSSRVPVLDAG